MNTYGYVGGNPLGFTDILGLAYSESGEHGITPYTKEQCKELREFIENQRRMKHIWEEVLAGRRKEGEGYAIKEIANILMHGCYTNTSNPGITRMCIIHEGVHLTQLPAALLIGPKEFSSNPRYKALMEIDAYEAGIREGERLLNANCKECDL